MHERMNQTRLALTIIINKKFITNTSFNPFPNSPSFTYGALPDVSAPYLLKFLIFEF